MKEARHKTLHAVGWFHLYESWAQSNLIYRGRKKAGGRGGRVDSKEVQVNFFWGGEVFYVLIVEVTRVYTFIKIYQTR